MLQNKVIVITGGAGLIGQAFVKAVVENGGIAIIADINTDNAKKVKNQLSADDSKQIDTVLMDITSKQSICNAIEAINKKYSKIDALVNNAYPRNKNYGRHFFEVAYQDFAENVSMHLGGYFLCAQQFAAYFKNQGAGNIINMSSIYGKVAPKFDIYQGTDITVPVEYVAIKSGVIHLTKYMAKYFKGINIRVNCISPGGIYNKQPQSFVKFYNNECLNKGMLSAKDLMGTLVYLLSDNSQYVNGQNIVVDDGFTL